jgi:lysozyme
VYQKKDMFLYYLGFKTKNTELTANQRKLEDARINDIVANHEGKIFGIDVSQYQGTIDWENLEAIEEQFEIKFVVVRATAGSKKVDRNFKKNWRNLSSTVYIQGAYHYYRPDENSTDQANNFIKNVKLRKGHLPPILDIEKMPKGQSMEKLKEGLQNWLTLVEKQYGVKPIIYTGEKYFEDFLQDDFPNYKFWIANYNPWKEKIEDNYLMWQFTEKAQLHGINELVDVNVFNGNVADLKKVCIK